MLDAEVRQEYALGPLLCIMFFVAVRRVAENRFFGDAAIIMDIMV